MYSFDKNYLIYRDGTDELLPCRLVDTVTIGDDDRVTYIFKSDVPTRTILNGSYADRYYLCVTPWAHHFHWSEEWSGPLALRFYKDEVKRGSTHDDFELIDRVDIKPGLEDVDIGR